VRDRDAVASGQRADGPCVGCGADSDTIRRQALDRREVIRERNRGVACNAVAVRDGHASRRASQGASRPRIRRGANRKPRGRQTLDSGQVVGKRDRGIARDTVTVSDGHASGRPGQSTHGPSVSRDGRVAADAVAVCHRHAGSRPCQRPRRPCVGSRPHSKARRGKPLDRRKVVRQSQRRVRRHAVARRHRDPGSRTGQRPRDRRPERSPHNDAVRSWVRRDKRRHQFKLVDVRPVRRHNRSRAVRQNHRV
jgi:hypothetical protein